MSVTDDYKLKRLVLLPFQIELGVEVSDHLLFVAKGGGHPIQKRTNDVAEISVLSQGVTDFDDFRFDVGPIALVHMCKESIANLLAGQVDIFQNTVVWHHFASLDPHAFPREKVGSVAP